MSIASERISKKIFDQNGTWVETTYYIRDAQRTKFQSFCLSRTLEITILSESIASNAMATYLNTNGTSESFDLTERYIYGSSRLGVYKEPEKDVDTDR